MAMGKTLSPTVPYDDPRHPAQFTNTFMARYTPGLTRNLGKTRDQVQEALKTVGINDWKDLQTKAYPMLQDFEERTGMLQALSDNVGSPIYDAMKNDPTLNEMGAAVKTFAEDAWSAMGGSEIVEVVNKATGVVTDVANAVPFIGSAIGASVGFLVKMFTFLFDVSNPEDAIHEWTGGPDHMWAFYRNTVPGVGGALTRGGNGPVVTYSCRESRWYEDSKVAYKTIEDHDGGTCCSSYSMSSGGICNSLTRPAEQGVPAGFKHVRTDASGLLVGADHAGKYIAWWNGGFGPWQKGLQYPRCPQSIHEKVLRDVMLLNPPSVAGGRSGFPARVVADRGMYKGQNGQNIIIRTMVTSGSGRKLKYNASADEAVKFLLEVRDKADWSNWQGAMSYYTRQYVPILQAYGVPQCHIDTLGWLFWFVPLPDNFSQIIDATQPIGDLSKNPRTGQISRHYAVDLPTIQPVGRAKFSASAIMHNKPLMVALGLAAAAGLVYVAMKDE